MAQDTLFPIDPVKTDLTAPVSSVQVQSPLDTTLTTTTRSAGIKNFADAFTKLSLKKQANAIHNDTITAELAAAYDQEMPGGLEPEAQFAYNRAVDLTTKRKVLQQMEDFSAIEGSDILHDERMDRKTRATSFKNQLLGLVNLGKGSISQANAAEMFSDIDAKFDKVMSAANITLAKDKKQEVLTAMAEAFRSTMNDHLGFMEELAPKVSDTDALGNELSPAQFAKNQKEFSAGWLAKHINSKWFNAAVKQIARTNTGAEIEDIKATALAIVGDELLKRVAKNPEIVQEKLMADIIANVPGSRGVNSLQDEIDSQSDFGKKIDTINKEFKRNLKSTLDNLDKDQAAANKARDDRIANNIQDGISDGSIKTKEEALAHARGINDPSRQRQVENHIRKHFSGENKKDIGHADYGPLVKYGAENFYDAETDYFNYAGFYDHAGEQGFKTSAIKTAAEEANPQTRRGKRRKEFFDQESIKQLTKSFNEALKSTLRAHDLLSKYDKLAAKMGEDSVNLNDPLVRKKLGITGKVGLKIRRVLDAQIALGAVLESLVRNNPDVPVYQLIPEAQKAAQGLIQDAITGEPFGTAVAESGKEKVKTDGTAVAESGKEKVKTDEEKLDAKKGAFSTNTEAKKDYVAQAAKEIKASDAKRAELIKDQKTFKTANIAERALLISKWGADPNNIREVVSRRAMAIQTNPDPVVRTYLKALELEKREGIPTTIQQPMKLERPSAWEALADFLVALPREISELPEKVSESLAETSRKLFWGGDEEIKPTKFSPLTTKVIGQTSEGRNIYENEDGSQSSERSITFEVDGKFYNWPTIFDGVELGPKQAIKKFHLHNGLDPETNIQSQPFNSEAEAIQAAEERSEKLKIADATPTVDGAEYFKDLLPLAGSEYFPELSSEDLLEIGQWVGKFVMGEFHSSIGDSTVVSEKGGEMKSQLTNRGIARKIYKEFPESMKTRAFKREPNLAEVKKLLKKYLPGLTFGGKEIKPNEVSPKEPSPNTTVSPGDSDILTTATSKFVNEPAIDKNNLTKTANKILNSAQSLFIEKASGEEVVNEAIDLVNKVGFPDDKGFLKEIAKHESRLGKHRHTFRKNYHGGIYQIDKIGFKKTQDVKSHPTLKKWYKKIKDITGIDWTKVKWKDLRKPSYSTLAARLYLVTIPKLIPNTLKERSVYYKEHYNKSGKGTPSKFMKSQK